MLYTDRSVYRPGQRVLWKSVVYRSDPGEDDYRVVRGKGHTIELVDANGELVAKADVETNRWGSASGEFVIPPGRLLGGWTVRASIGGSSSIRVEEYKRPTFEVTLDDAAETLRLNRSAELAGRAEYLFGLPLAGGQVRWRVESEPVYPRHWWRWGGPIASAEIVASGEEIVDAEGGFAFSFVPEADERLASQGISYRYRVRAEVTDEGGETRSAERSFRLGFVSLEAQLSPTQEFYESSEPISIEVARTDLDGADRSGVGRWKLMRLRGPRQAPMPADLPRIARPDEEAFYTEGDLMLARWEAPRRSDAELSGWNESELVSTGRDRTRRGPLDTVARNPAARRVPCPLPLGRSVWRTVRGGRRLPRRSRGVSVAEAVALRRAGRENRHRRRNRPVRRGLGAPRSRASRRDLPRPTPDRPADDRDERRGSGRRDPGNRGTTRWFQRPSQPPQRLPAVAA